MSSPRRGAFIVFEGGEGCGKSTQATELAHHLGALLTREPGGTPVGERIRDQVLHSPATITPRAEVLLFLAARAQHVDEVILPALERGRDVVCDRFSGSTIAYQGWGRGLDSAGFRESVAWAAAGVRPDLTVLLQLDAEEARRRMGAPGDRIESEDLDFHRRVDDGFRHVAAEEPGWVTVDASGAVEEVAARVRDAVRRWQEAQ
ncbi:MAG TPA: dTMP kinase [Acidimicrobiales bacterium]|nr:dTMP kinase [Acidimicrobiales bacterium]